MKRFLWKACLFIIPFIVIAFVFEYGLSLIPNTYNAKRHNFESQLDSVEILVLGSSQGIFDLNPVYFTHKGFNLSNTSQSLFYDKELLIKYIDRMPKLKCVVINFSSFSLGAQVGDGIEPWRDFYYYQFWEIKDPKISWFEFKLYSKVFLYTPKNALLYASKLFKVDLSTNLTANGFQFRDTANNYKEISDSLGRIRVSLHNKYFFARNVAENRANLEQLIVEIKKRGVTPVIVTPPVFKTYSKYADKRRLKSNVLFIDSLCAQHGCVYYDYFTDKRFDIRDFSDNDHMNFVGAKKFSEILNSEVLSKVYCREKVSLH